MAVYDSEAEEALESAAYAKLEVYSLFCLNTLEKSSKLPPPVFCKPKLEGLLAVLIKS